MNKHICTTILTMLLCFSLLPVPFHAGEVTDSELKQEDYHIADGSETSVNSSLGKNEGGVTSVEGAEADEDEVKSDEKALYTHEADDPLIDFTVEERNITIPANKETALTVTYQPADTTMRPVWFSSNTNIVTVDENGVLTGSSLGRAIVSANWLLKTVLINVRVGFSDVDPSMYYYDSVYWALDHGITGGMNATDFMPESICTRGQIMTFLWKINGSPEPDLSDNPFTDVSSNRFFYKPILWAYQIGLTAGKSDTLFAPDDPCTRGQVMTFLWKCQKNLEKRDIPFKDVSRSAYYYHPVKWAYHQGITTGTSPENFSPNAPCTRGQIVTFLYQCRDNRMDIYDKNKVDAFDDLTVAALDEAGWTLEGAFRWSASLTYYGHNSEMPSDESPGIEWFANYGFTHRKGNCYVMSCTFYKMAKMLGYEVYVMSGYVPSRRGGKTPHSWTEIIEDGQTYVYDPNFTNETGGDGYRIYYGKSGTWMYSDYHRMEQ